jgi:lysophospholipase L1-like esterase
LRLSNRFGTGSAHVREVWAAHSAGQAAVKAGTAIRVTFSGAESVSIPRGESVFSDPFDLVVVAADSVVVSLYVAGRSGPAAGHTSSGPSHGSRFLADGNQAAALMGDVFGPPSNGTSFLVGLDVDAPNDGAIVTLGDSVTEGASSERAYSEFLADRIRSSTTSPRLSVVNAGVGGDAICKILPSRITDDVLSVTGVAGVILTIGINDIGGGRELRTPQSAEAVIAGIKDAVGQLERGGLIVWVSPLPPSGDADRPSVHVPHYSSPEQISKRHAINDWIRGSRWYDARIDFEQALLDPDHPEWIRIAWSADNLHPGTEGQARMAASVDLSIFQILQMKG